MSSKRIEHLSTLLNLTNDEINARISSIKDQERRSRNLIMGRYYILQRDNIYAEAYQVADCMDRISALQYLQLSIRKIIDEIDILQNFDPNTNDSITSS
ncbi:hypothetical protein TVAG_297300 [Trichomonas vaginalis G3]|uniref:Uncharacterized protein n=1 Tax=Trichomonas vaginalis (strain ATCC PRA-98 / G3) TaxID=412133 RepID=A2DRC5_TRIV3|nr:hypothetical protein TVAGG3_0513040 [Trichomonas vaginalis G3]EAY17051.1 hypothetical protein TVAG_297300 [Trichomonas vaginalis G3]KAI5517921.1 hypothetical protein TVAGG3_0513040 [Trichomonas vaginalis G3]|eukprot:XP_001329274.1 hypothetical protein [Trichomonas vaginalis G3]